MIKAIFANNLPSSLTHGDTVAVGSLQLSLARKGSFTTGQRQRKRMLSVGTLASRRKELTRGLGCAFPNSPKFTLPLGRKSRCVAVRVLPLLGRKQQVSSRNVPLFHNDNKPIFFFFSFLNGLSKTTQRLMCHMSHGFVQAHSSTFENRIQIHFSRN